MRLLVHYLVLVGECNFVHTPGGTKLFLFLVEIVLDLTPAIHFFGKDDITFWLTWIISTNKREFSSSFLNSLLAWTARCRHLISQTHFRNCLFSLCDTDHSPIVNKTKRPKKREFLKRVLNLLNENRETISRIMSQILWAQNPRASVPRSFGRWIGFFFLCSNISGWSNGRKIT